MIRPSYFRTTSFWTAMFGVQREGVFSSLCVQDVQGTKISGDCDSMFGDGVESFDILGDPTWTPKPSD